MLDGSCVARHAGMHAWDAAGGEHILSTAGLTSEIVACCGPFILRQVLLSLLRLFDPVCPIV